jgi:arginine decarboxylase
VKTPLAKALQAQIALNRHRFHVPAHAGSNFTGFSVLDESLYVADFTELPDLDVLGNPQGVLRDSQAEAAKLYQAAQTYYLINGASVGLMAVLLAYGTGKVLVARNCHRSIIHGLLLSGAMPEWILPEVDETWGVWGAISPETLEIRLQESPDIGLFVMTHPTYEGIGSDILAIAQICRKNKVKLLVDEAHGSLWPLSDALPTSSMTAGADAVVHSLHKSGGSLTQTALLHLSEDSGFPPEEIQEALNLLQTTSPSYPLLANIEATCAFWNSPEGLERIHQSITMAQEMRQWIAQSLSTIHVLDTAGLQIFLKSSKLWGEDLATTLEETHDIAFEAATPYGVLLLMNLGLTDSAISALKTALVIIDTQYKPMPDITFPPLHFALPKTQLSPRDAYLSTSALLLKADCVGKISRQVVATCPPGIPLLIPGEVISGRHLPLLPDSLMIVGYND